MFTYILAEYNGDIWSALRALIYIHLTNILYRWINDKGEVYLAPRKISRFNMECGVYYTEYTVFIFPEKICGHRSGNSTRTFT
jgi:hypothetical protein